MEPTAVEAMLTRPFRVRSNRKELADTRTLELVSPGGDMAPEWRPGQFMMLYMFGIGEIAISISGNPRRRGELTHTVRAVGAVSQAICAAKPGSAVGVRGPFGKAWPIDQCEGDDIVIVAGGIGLAPLRPVVETVLSNRKRYGRASLLVGARTPEIVLYAKQIERWRQRNLDVRISVDAATPGWQGAVGPVTILIPRAQFDPGRTTAFICGPEIMMRFVVQGLAERGIPRDRLFVSMERNMKCAIGFCGHCQLGPAFICKNGPVFAYPELEPWISIRNM
jgi:NAD(P)H-flavin reductase